MESAVASTVWTVDLGGWPGTIQGCSQGSRRSATALDLKKGEPLPSHLVEHVDLEPIPPSRREVIGTLLQLYLHDFSEHATLGSPHGEVDEAGRFAYPHLDLYWQDAGRSPFLIRADGRVAGFVLVNRWSALDQPLDHAVAEFFVLRKYRLARVGLRAAHLVFHRSPGRWEVPVAIYNHAALLFWRRVVGSLPITVGERAGDGRRWAGPVLYFDTRQAD